MHKQIATPKRRLTATLLLAIGLCHAGLTWAATPRDEGMLEPIWRTQPVIGRWLSGGLGLIRPPSYLFQTSFPYRKRPFDEEVLFADRLIVVRLLGGWNTELHSGELNGAKEADLAYRDDDGKIRYRWNLLFGRLDPYIRNGYRDLTLVLDNTPWDLAKVPVLQSYGQTAPPENMREWRAFMRQLAKQLVDKYGYETVSHFRFRLGTECQHTTRFSGTHKQYIQQYLATLKGIRSVLPDSAIGPCNHSGGKKNTAANNVDFGVFYDQVAKRMAPGYKVADFYPVSIYFVTSTQATDLPASQVRALSRSNDDYWQRVTQTASGAASPTREVHEAGMLLKTSAGNTLDLGIFGATWYLNTLIGLKQLDVTEVAHWSVLDQVGGRPDQQLLTGPGWVLSVLDHLAGGRLYVYNEAVEGDVAINRVLVVKDDASYLVVSTYGTNGEQLRRVSTPVPRTLLHGQGVHEYQTVSLTPANSVCSRIKSDLAAAQVLDPVYQGDLAPCVDIDRMMTVAGRELVTQNWSGYQQAMVDSLTLRDASTAVREDGDHLRVVFELPTPAIQVLRIR